MAFTFVQKKEAQNGNNGASLTTTLDAPPTAGNLLIAWVKNEISATTVTVTEGSGNFTSATQQSHGSVDLIGQFFYKLIAEGGDSSIVTTWAVAKEWRHVQVWEYSYTGTAEFDTEIATADGNSNAPATGNVTTDTNCGLVACGIALYGSRTVNSGTADINGVDADQNQTIAASQAHHSWIRSTGTLNFTGQGTGTLSSSVEWLAHLISFKTTGGGSTYTLTADSGTFTIAGTAAGLKYGHKVGASVGSYAITGTAATLKYGHKVTASSGSFVITGTDAGLKVGRKIAAAAGSFTISGTNATLNYGHKLITESDTYVITGTDAALKAARILACSAGSYVITGTDADLIYLPTGAYLLSAESGTFTITGSDATLTYSEAVEIPPDTGENPDDVHLHNYFRRYANDRDQLSEIEDLVTEETGVAQTSDDQHFEDYLRRYTNDRGTVN